MYSELASSRLQFWGGQLWRLLHWPVTTRRLLLYQLQGHHQVEKVAEEQLVSGHLDPCSDQSSVNLLFVGHLELVVLLLWRYSRWGNQLWFESPRPEHDACLCQEARKRAVAVRKKESGSLNTEQALLVGHDLKLRIRIADQVPQDREVRRNLCNKTTLNWSNKEIQLMIHSCQLLQHKWVWNLDNGYWQ